MGQGKVVFGVIDTDAGAHMVTIVASDINNYYCASGFEDAQRIPKEDLSKYNIYVYNGKKTPYK